MAAPTPVAFGRSPSMHRACASCLLAEHTTVDWTRRAPSGVGAITRALSLDAPLPRRPSHWGDGDDGQLGNGSLELRNLPTRAQGAQDGWAQVVVAAGGSPAAERTAARSASDRSLWCWGQNSAGQAGQPASAAVTSPQRVCLPQLN
jgi:hypothetical protein